MNIYDFFNSPDAAKHCQSIGHTFNVVESAVMINQSRSRTLTEKHAAYRTIIAEYTDMSLPKAINHGYIRSFKEELEKVIAYEQHSAEHFLTPESGAVYQVSIYCRNTDDPWELDLFSTYEKALDNALEILNDDENMRYGYSSQNFMYMRICKIYLDQDSENQISASAKVSKSGEIISINENGIFPPEKVHTLLESIYIYVPVPFKRGDLVEYRDGYYMGDVYVLQDICFNHPEQHTRSLLKGDTSDMTAWVFYEHKGIVNCECIHFYPDLRYCRRELKGETQILKYISLQMQEKLCLCDLLKIQKYLLLDKKVSELKDDHELKYQLDKIGDKLLGDSAQSSFS